CSVVVVMKPSSPVPRFRESRPLQQYYRRRLSRLVPDHDFSAGQYVSAVRAYTTATRIMSSISTHSLTVCCPPARGPCVIVGTSASRQKLLPSSTNAFGPSGSVLPPAASWLERNAATTGWPRFRRNALRIR